MPPCSKVTSVAFVVIIFFFISRCVMCNESVRRQCMGQTNCGSCLRANSGCAWCAQNFQTFSNGSYRCDLLEHVNRSGCETVHVVHPQNSLTILQDSHFSKETQLRPQKLLLDLRLGSSSTFEVKFRQEHDYPVDLYFLTDSSATMRPYKIHLVNIASTLAKEMAEITTDFLVGFGSFVDKPTMPFISTIRSDKKLPCPECAFPYSFKHHMSLSKNFSAFQTLVTQLKPSGNLDDAEGGFDALMQSLVCNEKIGWRLHSRKLLVFATDAVFHYAGDAKLAGIVVPNDGKCHLDYNSEEDLWEYTESLNQDYPSVAEINRAVKRNKINVIFAIPQKVHHAYRKLSSRVEGSVVGQLAESADNIIQIVKDEYKKIRSSVALMDSAPLDAKITYTACSGADSIEGTTECHNLTQGSEVSWNVTVELTDCPRTTTQSIKIFSHGLTDEIAVNLSPQCNCDCEKAVASDLAAPLCSGNGDYQCGICVCREGFDGKACECRISDSYTTDDKYKGCVSPSNPDGAICSGRGHCICGQCQCSIRPTTGELIYGEYCQFDNFNCERFDRLLCAGHGMCDKGICHCEAGWTGKACSCTLSNQTCTTNTGKVCNNHGRCKCGQCICDESGEHKFSGPKCEDCPLCPSPCRKGESCVGCWNFETGTVVKNGDPLNHTECPSECQEHSMNFVEQISKSPHGGILCSFRDTLRDFCTVYFSHHQDIFGNSVIQIQQKRQCPEPVNSYMIVGVLVGGILFIGALVLLSWKAAIVIYDRRQVAKFEEETRRASFDAKFSNNLEDSYSLEDHRISAGDAFFGRDLSQDRSQMLRW